MNSLDKITLKSFLVALKHLDNSLPDDLQTQVNEIGKDLISDAAKLHNLTKKYSPLEKSYKEARRFLQQKDEERFRSTLEIDYSFTSDEKLIDFAFKVLNNKDSVSFIKNTYTESSELKYLLSQLQPQKNPLKVKILDLLGEYCFTTDKGQKVYDLIYPQLSASQPVELDFTGVEIAAPPFLNFAIGQLFKDIHPETFNSLVKISHLNPLDEETLEIIIDDCKQYYSDQDFRSRVDKVISELASTFQ